MHNNIIKQNLFPNKRLTKILIYISQIVYSQLTKYLDFLQK